MTMTTTRSRQKSVVIKHPFWIERLLPAGSADEESMEGFVSPDFTLPQGSWCQRRRPAALSSI
jgi:hypothetical protein